MRLIVRLSLLLLLAPQLVAQSLDTRSVDRVMEQTIKAWGIPGAAVAIVRDDKVVYVKGYGVKEIGGTDRVTPDTLFGIASTSKAFTSTALAMLVDEKKVSWDDPVRKHLDYFRLSDPCADSLITLRDIVSHRSGLSRHDELWDNTALTREQVIRAAASIRLSKPFRSAHQYSNIMFMVAGEVVAAASRSSWDDFQRTRILEPLGMTHTRTSVADFLASDHATGHRYARAANAAVVQPLSDDSNLGPAGAIKSSARDMAQWLRFQLAEGVIDGKRLVSVEALGETKIPQSAIRFDASSKETNPETNVQSYAMGWNVQDYRGELLISHGGALNGFRTQVDLLPSRRAGFVVIINEGRGLATVALRNALSDLLLDRPFTDWNTYYLAVDRRSVERDETRKRERESKRKIGTKPSRELTAYAGSFANPAYGTATIALENGTLVLRWQRIVLPLVHHHYDVFAATSEEADIDELASFRLGNDGEVKTLMLFEEEWTKKAP